MDDKLYETLDLMKRMGESLPNFSYYEVLMNQKPLLIKEGLIMTYPTDNVVSILSSLYGLKINNKTNLLGRNEEKNENGNINVVKLNGEEDTIIITLKNNSLFNDINAHCLKYGWVNYRTDEENKNKIYYFEKRFGDRFTANALKNMCKKIYHITSSTLKNKILKQGLVPKESKTHGFKNEPRIYFRIDLPSKEQAYSLNLMKFNLAPPIVFEIDVEKLDKSHAFFFDSRWQNSIFTFEPIPVNAIRLMDNNELLEYKLI